MGIQPFLMGPSLRAYCRTNRIAVKRSEHGAQSDGARFFYPLCWNANINCGGSALASEKQCETFLCKPSNAKLYRGKGLPSITTNNLSSHVPSVLKPLEVYKLTCFHAPSIFLRLIEMSSIRIPHLSWPFWLLICIGVLQHTESSARMVVASLAPSDAALSKPERNKTRSHWSSQVFTGHSPWNAQTFACPTICSHGSLVRAAVNSNGLFLDADFFWLPRWRIVCSLVSYFSFDFLFCAIQWL